MAYVAGAGLVGRRRGKLVVLKALGNHRILVQCDCGATKEIARTAFYHSKSCGCRQFGKEPGVSARRQVWMQYQSDAADRGLVWALSDVDFDRLTGSSCHYCGRAPATVKATTNGSFTYNGIDRVDNGRGYLADNAVSCCRRCNRAKDTMSVDDFIAWAKQVAQHNEVK